MNRGPAYMSGLIHNGPPPGANDDFEIVTQWYRRNSVAEVKQLSTRASNSRRLLLLTGQDEKYDGLLQGIYCYVPAEELDTSLGNDASYIVVNDGRSAWYKLT